MLERLFLERLLDWKNRPERKPILLDGARQVGKTYLLETLFGSRHFRRVHKLDLDERPELHDLFAGSLNPGELLPKIEAALRADIDLRADLLAGVNSTGQRFSSVPVFVKSLSGKAGIARRQCTREYKLSPIEAELRDLLGLGYRQAVPDGVYVELWIGISTDEAALRMKASRERWIEHRWPLVELGYSRDDCRAWFAERWPGRVLPRSACIGCPYHTDAEWAEMKRGDPRSWADAIFVDDALRADGRADRFAGEVYLHQSLTPLSAIAFGNEPEQGELFDAECEGMCGV